MIRCRSSIVALHLRPPQVEIAILEPQVLAGQLLAARLKRRREALVEQRPASSARTSISPVASFGLAVPSGRWRHLAGDRDHELAPQRAGQLLVLGAALGPEDDLRLAVAVAQVDEQMPPPWSR